MDFSCLALATTIRQPAPWNQCKAIQNVANDFKESTSKHVDALLLDGRFARRHNFPTQADDVKETVWWEHDS